MGTDPERRAEGGEPVWYARPEAAGPWRMPACAEHGAELQRHRFARVGRRVELAGGSMRSADYCAVCRSPELLDQVERCTCETDSARCPVHQNIGCGG